MVSQLLFTKYTCNTDLSKYWLARIEPAAVTESHDRRHCDDVLALKGNQRALYGDVSPFLDAPGLDMP